MPDTDEPARFDVLNRPDGTAVVLHGGEPVCILEHAGTQPSGTASYRAYGIFVQGKGFLENLADTSVSSAGHAVMTDSDYDSFLAPACQDVAKADGRTGTGVFR